MAVFYQIYRPKNFSEVIGQESIVRTLQQAVSNKNVGHAYLFTGSRGIGKTTLARILAKAVNCEKVKDGNPCGACDVCTSIAAGNFLDVIEIDAASHTGVDNIRELIEHIHFQPTRGRTKVFVIDEVHMLSKAAFNALLKTLEEPPANVLFILATTDIEKVLDTIISRTQRFDFRKITGENMKPALEQIVKNEKLKLPAGTLDVIVENSEGGLRDALSQLSMAAHLDSSSSIDDVHLLLGTTARASVIELLNLIAQGSTGEMSSFFKTQTAANFDAASFARKTLVILQEHLEVSLSKQQGAPDLVTQFSLNQLLYIIRLFMRAYKEIDRATSSELPLLLASIEAAMFIQPGSSDSGTDKDEPTYTPGKRAGAAPAISKMEVIEEKVSLKQPAMAKDVPEASAQNSVVFNSSDIELDTAQVIAWWPGLIANVKSVNSPLATLLKNSPLHEVSGNKIIIGVKYLFHKEQLEAAKVRTQITNFLREKAGGDVEFRVVIAKDSMGEQIVDTAAAVSDALKIFGGELVE
ncbi:DNA polymerase III subunit gamma/tau [bacterium]|nr:MAG: DNA polymerase III subunit gamma/tau [bacterium]